MASVPGTSGSSASLSNAGESYIGSFLSLVSKCEIRYEGVLCFLNIQDSTIGLQDVRSYGTEGRRKDGPQVPASDKVYEYILFRGNDIKNLQIKSLPTSAKAEEQKFRDPAIIQSQYSWVLNSPVPSVGGRSLTDSIQKEDGTTMSSKALPVGLPSHQSVTEHPSNQSTATQVASLPSLSTAMHWQGHTGTSSNSSLLQYGSPQPPSLVSALAMQNQMQTAETLAPKKVGLPTLSENGPPISSANAASLVNPICSPSLTSLQIPGCPDIPSLFPTKTPMPFSSSSTFGELNMSSFSSPLQDINSIKGQISGKYSPDPRPIYPHHSVHHPVSSFVDSTSGPLPKPPPLLTPAQFEHPRQQLFSSTRSLNANQNDMGSLTLTSSGSSVLMPSRPASQPPLLPLPTSVQKPQYSASQFTEEFDFEAMNEKFKKDEVWGSLGKETAKIEGVEDYVSPQNLSHKECHGMIPLPDPQPAYNKDDFFDTISCNSMTRGSRNNRLSERMKLDTETFGNFQQRHNIGYVRGYGVGRGESFRGSYNWGRGNGNGMRGRGPNFRH